MDDSNSQSEDRPNTVHRPVMLREVLHWLEIQPGQTIVDGTLGGGGHAVEIARRLGEDGILLGVDRDASMLERAAQTLGNTPFHACHGSYADLPNYLLEHNIPAVDAILVDLGLSSDQLADPNRGFGFSTEGTLDLRFDTRFGQPAWEWLASSSESDIVDAFTNFGEETRARSIAAQIVRQRRSAPIRTTNELCEAIEAAVPAGARRGKTHPATRVFQALRIAVNEELEQLQRALDDSFLAALRPGGRVVAISFHSLEDRLVKHAFKRQDQWQNLTTKPIEPRPAEKRANPRSRSAKLRAAIKK